MRTFTIRKGLYAGEHTIYDSEKEAKDNGISPKKPWHDPNVAVGDWIVSDDGYVVQCLGRRSLINKRHRSGQYTDTFRFPQGIFYVYHGKKSDSVKNFYAQLANHNKSSLGNTSKLGKFMTIKKKEFVSLVQLGYDPYSACVKAYNIHTSTPGAITAQVNKLLSDPQIREALMQALQPYMEQVQQHLKEITGYQDLNQMFVEKAAKLLGTEHKDPRVEIMTFKLGLELFGTTLGIVETPSVSPINKRELEEAHFTQLPPVPLAPKKE